MRPASASSTLVLVLAEARFHGDALSDALGRRGMAAVSQWDLFVDLTGASETATPPLVVLDVAAEERATTLRSILDALPDARVVVLAVRDTESELVPVVQAGATACVPPHARLDDVVAALGAVADDRRWYSPKATQILLRRAAGHDLIAPADRPLTPREREILTLIEQGLSNKQIAKRLSIRLPTVKNHVHNILRKLSVESRNEAAAKLRSVRGQTRGL